MLVQALPDSTAHDFKDCLIHGRHHPVQALLDLVCEQKIFAVANTSCLWTRTWQPDLILMTKQRRAQALPGNWTAMFQMLSGSSQLLAFLKTMPSLWQARTRNGMCHESFVFFSQCDAKTHWCFINALAIRCCELCSATLWNHDLCQPDSLKTRIGVVSHCTSSSEC